MTADTEPTARPQALKDNYLSMLIGVAQIAAAFYLDGQIGNLFISIGIIGLVGTVTAFSLYWFTSDWSSAATVAGLTILALFILVVPMAPAERLPPRTTISAQVYFDRNQNGRMDGNEGGISGLPVVVRDDVRRPYPQAITAIDGSVEILIVAVEEVQIIACGVAQTHLIAGARNYTVVIGIEQEDLNRCNFPNE